MNKDDLNEIKKIVDSSLEKHLASVHEEISDLRADMDKGHAELKSDNRRIENKLDNFEKSERDTRLQIEVRVATIEKHVGLPTPVRS